MIDNRTTTAPPGRRLRARFAALAAGLGVLVITVLGLTALPASASTTPTVVQKNAENGAMFAQGGDLIVAAICLAIITAVGAAVIWYTARARGSTE